MFRLLTRLVRRLIGTDSKYIQMKARNKLLKLRLEAKELECELLADVNENMRQWILGSTAYASRLGEALGAPQTPASSRPLRGMNSENSNGLIEIGGPPSTR